MATHSSMLAWRVPWTEEPGGLHPMGWQGAGHDWVTKRSTTQGQRMACVLRGPSKTYICSVLCFHSLREIY